jgi:hypothetical protein
LALQPYVSLGLLCYSSPPVSILSFPSPSFNPPYFTITICINFVSESSVW